MRLRVASDCPASDDGMVGVQPARPDLTDRMVPDATPTAGLTCRYYGLNGQAHRLAATHRLDANGAGALESALRQTILSHPDGVVTNCPNDTGEAVVMALSYAKQPDVDLWFDPAGCSFVANGLIRGRPVGLAEALGS
jgi:hypothetical protein